MLTPPESLRGIVSASKNGFLPAGLEGNSVDPCFATVWDEGLVLASRRVWWCIPAQIEEQLLGLKIQTQQQNRKKTSCWDGHLQT